MQNYEILKKSLLHYLGEKRAGLFPVIEKLLVKYQEEKPILFERFINNQHFEVIIKNDLAEIISMRECCGEYIARYKMLIQWKNKKISIITFDK